MYAIILILFIGINQQVLVCCAQGNQNQSTPAASRSAGPLVLPSELNNQKDWAPVPGAPIGSSSASINSNQVISGNNTSAKPASKTMDPSVVEYLQKYGYMKSTKELGGSISPKVFSESMIKFQHSLGLNETGVVSEEDLKMMAAPRCGNIEETRKLDKSLRKKIPRKR